VRWCDVSLHNNINLRSAWPLLLIRRPWGIINGGALPQNLTGHIKRFCARFAFTTGVSEDAARNIGSKVVIPNCYDNDLFHELPDVDREIELMFLGRLQSDKGVHILLEALQKLKLRGRTPRLTIVGGGPEEAKLRSLVSELSLTGQVTFAGVKRGAALVCELNRHKVLVVPSIYNEPFGIVALEGIACGCVVVGTERGGLREAIGPCGITVPNGDALALANCLEGLLSDAGRILALRKPSAEHLAHFTKEKVAEAYLSVLGTLCQSKAAASPGQQAY
jgi:glycosyltransferase involved in cell wall biosynthesis